MTASSLLDHPLLEPVLLRRASLRAQAFSDAQRARMAPYVDMARRQHHTALELRDPETLLVACGLLRDAAFHVLLALESAAAEDTPSSSLQAAWARFFDIEPEAKHAPAYVEAARPLLAAQTSLVELASSEHALGALRVSAESSVTWLLSLAEVRPPGQLSRLRGLRIALSAGALLAIAWALLSYWFALRALAARTNP